MHKLIIKDTGKDKYRIITSFRTLGRMYDHLSEEIYVTIPDTELKNNSICTMIVTTKNGTVIDQMVITADTPIPVTSNLSIHKEVYIGFCFSREDGYVKNSEIKRFEFGEAQMPDDDFKPVSPERKLDLLNLIARGFVKANLNDGTLHFHNIHGESVSSITLKLSDFENDTKFVDKDYVDKFGGKIDSISINGEPQIIDSNKNIDLIIPTKNSELENDIKYATEDYVDNSIPSDYVTINSEQTIECSKTIIGNLTIEGNIIQNGKEYITHAQEVITTNDFITLREGAKGGLGRGYSGFEVKLYDGAHDGRLVIDANGIARVGDVGDEQPLATREENPIDGGFAVWSASDNKFITTGGVDNSVIENKISTLQTNLQKVINNETVIGAASTPLVIGYGAKGTKDDNETLSFGYNASATGGISTAVGASANSNYLGVAIGAKSYAGVSSVAVGYNSSASGGVAIGSNAETQSFNSVQIGGGINSKNSSVQIYNDNIYDISTHTLTVQNIELNGKDINTLIPDISKCATAEQLSSYLPLSGGELTGSLTFSTGINFLRSPDIDKTVSPTCALYQYFDFQDKNKQRLGVIGSQQDPYGYYGTYLQAGNEGGMGIMSNGSNVYTFAPTPATNDYSTKIATTAFVKDNLTNYSAVVGNSRYDSQVGSNSLTGQRWFKVYTITNSGSHQDTNLLFYVFEGYNRSGTQKHKGLLSVNIRWELGANSQEANPNNSSILWMCSAGYPNDCVAYVMSGNTVTLYAKTDGQYSITHFKLLSWTSRDGWGTGAVTITPLNSTTDVALPSNAIYSTIATDSIVDFSLSDLRGNANTYNYIRYVTGQQVCWGRVDKGQVRVTFPCPFLDINQYAAFDTPIYGSGTSSGYGTTHNYTTTSFDVVQGNNSYGNWFAIGRWR